MSCIPILIPILIEEADSDSEKFRILETLACDDMIAVEALAKQFIDRNAETDKMAAIKAVEHRFKMKKSYVEAILNRQKAELEDFDRMKEMLLLNIVTHVQETLQQVLSESSVASKVQEQIMEEMGKRMQTIQIDLTVEKEK